MVTDQSFEDTYLDVLQNIEFGIVRVYRERPELTDWDALNATEALIRGYTAESRGRSRPNIRLSDLPQLVFDSVEAMCEWRLGRERPFAEGNQPVEMEMEPKTTDEIIACLKRIRKSIKRWNKEGGRQGYLNFVSEFVR
jgi:hypothetical protein